MDPFIRISVAEWNSNPGLTMERIRLANLGDQLIIRSSRSDEDSQKGPPPGTLLSRKGQSISDALALHNALNDVIKSYSQDGFIADAGFEEVIVQRELVQMRQSGVVTSRMPGSLAPFITIEFSSSSDSSIVTSGRNCSRCRLFRDSVLDVDLSSDEQAIIQALFEIESILCSDALLIEYAISLDGVMHVFQARNLTALETEVPIAPGFYTSEIQVASKSVAASGPLSDMADWNPAEILGPRPRPLAVSLYGYLITDKTWHEARTSLGYSEVFDPTLISLVCGKPYVNVTKSFMSLLPATTPAFIRRKYIDNRLRFLARNPQKHDKVEMEVFYHTLFLNPNRAMEILESDLDAVYVEELVHVCNTFNIDLLSKFLNNNCQDRKELDQLSLERKRIQAQVNDLSINEYINIFFQGIAVCQQYGTLPFARLARYAYVFNDIAKQLVECSDIDESAFDRLWANCSTVAQEMLSQINELSGATGNLSKFLSTYGHLRQSTYDITSPRLDQVQSMFEQLGAGRTTSFGPRSERSMEFCGNGLLVQHGFAYDWFSNAFALAIESREYAKLCFSGLISELMELLAYWGNDHGLDRDALSYLRLSDLRTSRNIVTDTCQLLDIAELNKHMYHARLNIPLPGWIESSVDLISNKSGEAQPTYITRSRVSGPAFLLKTYRDCSLIPQGAIIVTETADPGLDWVFAMAPKAIVTRYGGSGSHLAVRCAEFGLPAMIGCSDIVFERAQSAATIYLNCEEGVITFDTNF